MATVMAERALATRDKIIASAAHVFCERGYTGAGMAEIVLGTGMTRGAVYFHFSSKADLAKTLVDRHHADWQPLSNQAESLGLQGLDAVRHRIDVIAQQLRTDVVARAAVRLAREADRIEIDIDSPFDDWEEYFGYRLRQAQLLGQMRPDLDPTLYARIVVGMFLGVIEQCGLDIDTPTGRPEVGHDTSVVDAMWEMVLTGLQTAQN